MSRTATIITQFKAETLLEDSAILAQINQLKNDLKYRTDGTLIAFDDYYLRLQDMINKLPRLKLENALPGPGTENQYIIQLVQAMDELLDKAEYVEGRVIHFQSKLKDALGQVKRLQGAFDAWYILAASEVMSQLTVKLPPNAIKALADSEFTRLMDGLDISVGSLLLAVNVQQKEIANHKKVQNEKFSLGKDQANASWTSNLPSFGNSITERPTQFETPEVEEEDDNVPAFVSKKPATAAPAEDFTEEYATGPEEGPEETNRVRAEAGGPLPLPVKTVVSDKVVIGVPTIETFNEASPGAVRPEPVLITLPPTATVPANGPEEQLAPEPTVVHEPPKPKAAAPAAVFVAPADGTVIVREKEGFPEKIHCAVCHRRIKIGQTMFAAFAQDWRHAVEIECTGKAPVERKIAAIEPAVTDWRKEDHLPVPGPVTDDSIHHGPFPPVPELVSGCNNIPCICKPGYGHRVAEKGTNIPEKGTPVSASTLAELINRGRQVQQSPEEAEEQRRGFAAANVALDNGRPVEEVRKEVDKAAAAMAAAAPEIALTPRRSLVAFLDQEEEIL